MENKTTDKGTVDTGVIRLFDTGATRDTGTNKNDYEGFLSPLVLEAYGDYMTENRKQTDGQIRDSDNWQKGIPKPVYIKSAWRHFLQLWKIHRGWKALDEKGNTVDLKHALGGLLFNIMGYWHESLITREVEKPIAVPPPVKCKGGYPRFFARFSEKRVPRSIFVLISPEIGRGYYMCPMSSGLRPVWGDQNWILKEMTTPEHWISCSTPEEISSDLAVQSGLPNDTDTWPASLRNGWPHGRPQCISQVVGNSSTKASVLND